jgi:putative transposase
MRNHFHLLIRQLTDKGISDFMGKIGGYAYYFNKKHKRIGPLFQGRFKAILIKTENQLKSTFIYIHTNPVGIVEPEWKNWRVSNPKRAAQFLRNYKWSSYRDYIETGNADSLVCKVFFSEIFRNKDSCQKEVESWIHYKCNLGKIREITLE